MVLLPNLFEGGEACQIRLRSPVSEAALLLAEIYFDDRLLDVDYPSHNHLYCTLKGCALNQLVGIWVISLLPSGLTVCVSGLWAGWDPAWEQRKPEARKLLENPHPTHKSTARFVGWRLCYTASAISTNSALFVFVVIKSQ